MNRIAIFGMGLMGTPMTLKLAQGNIPVIAYNRTPVKLEPLKEVNVPVTTNIQEAIEFGDCLILMLADFNGIQEVIFNSGVDLTGKTIIQMGTIAPNESKKVLFEVEMRGGRIFRSTRIRKHS
ncbi:2-hydroxy-3-oxopropionate reductase [Geminocystis sp. NIES-3709]|nr:2-hydroxy-3-oxopropionate reductase [Geminocystis sp. NIES-3709]